VATRCDFFNLKILQNSFSAGVPPRTPLGELTTLPQTTWGGCVSPSPFPSPSTPSASRSRRLRRLGCQPPNTNSWLRLCLSLPLLLSFPSSLTPSLTQRIRGYFYNEMRYINLRFTYLLTHSPLLPLPFLPCHSFPSPPSDVSKRRPEIQLVGRGSAVNKLPSGSGQSPAAKRFLLRYGIKRKQLV